MSKIKQILIKRDGMTGKEAEQLIKEAKQDFYNRLQMGELPWDICEEWFGLEPDYLEDITKHL